ncbi:MAG: HlyC/CorC family transporter [Inquilinus sp.]|nr:HlyC/CorC family transporter [Inquilinus sp.]
MDTAIVLELVAFAALMVLSAFFSSSETALFSLNRLQQEQMRQRGNPSISLIERLLAQPRHLIVTILIGNELVNVAASVISAAVVIRFLGPEAKWVNLLIMVPLLLLLGEITPKTLAIRNNVAFATVQCRFIDLFARAITPLRWIVRHIAEFFITMIVGRERSRANIITEDMVRSLALEAVGDGVLDHEEALYINRIFDFADKALRDVMTPRSQILYLPAQTSLDDAILHYQRTGHTKVPVYKGSRDSVVGVFYIRDLLRPAFLEEPSKSSSSTVADLMRETYFVPETKSVADLFYTFRKRKLSLAVAVDEYGGVTGLITMEDLLECIFGDIVSRSELLQQQSMPIEKLDVDTYRIDAATPLHLFNKTTGADLDLGQAESVGGLLLNAFGELPREGQDIVVGGYVFEVVSVAGQRISKLEVKPVAALKNLPSEAGAPPQAPGYAVEARAAGRSRKAPTGEHR